MPRLRDDNGYKIKSLDKKEIENISYNYKDFKMIIKLKNKKLVKNFMSDEIIYNCSEKVFNESVKKWLKD